MSGLKFNISGVSASLISIFVCLQLYGQTRMALSTNLVDAADGGTLNMDAELSLSRHWSVEAGVKYNPYSESLRRREFSLGARFWPWYVYSGWWLSSAARYHEYSRTQGDLTEGDRVGLSLSSGYSWMLSKHFNLDVGWGIWGGYDRYKVFGCPTCAPIKAQGEEYFLLPDSFMLSVSYIF